jgi:hypothetical protein
MIMRRSQTTPEVPIEPESTRKRLPFPTGWYQEYRAEAMRCAPIRSTENGNLERDYSKLPSSAQMQRDFALFVERVGRDGLNGKSVRRHARRMYR